MQIAIAFGFGKQSFDMLEELKHKKPILIYVDCDDYDIDVRAFSYLGKLFKLRTIIIKNKKGFQEFWQSNDYNFYPGYSNTILRHYKRKKPFDVLYVGRRKRDVLERSNQDYWWFKEMDVKKIKGVEFPCWEKR